VVTTAVTARCPADLIGAGGGAAIAAVTGGSPIVGAAIGGGAGALGGALTSGHGVNLGRPSWR
jgi:hypothetical protein